MLQVTTAGWIATFGVLLFLILGDLSAGARHGGVPGPGQAARWSAMHVVVAVVFGLVLAEFAGREIGVQYLTAYAVEKSLSVDNLFVLVVLMRVLAVPPAQQHGTLTVGILAALFLRALFIAAGAELLHEFSIMFLIFGLALLVLAVELYRHRDGSFSPQRSRVLKLIRRWVPITRTYEGSRVFTRVNGRRAATPLFVVLFAVLAIDALFALDSIPAVFGVTNHAYVVFTANAFALLGLRELYFLVAALLDRLPYVTTGLAVIMGFIAVKLLLHWGHHVNPSIPNISTGLSLLVILLVLAIVAAAGIRAGGRRGDVSRA